MKTTLRMSMAATAVAVALALSPTGADARGLTDPAAHAPRVVEKAPEGSFQVAQRRLRRAIGTGLAIGAGAVIAGAVISGAARAADCRYVERCSPVTDCWWSGGKKYCETVGEKCRSVRVCD
jgi:hypothetical protein